MPFPFAGAVQAPTDWQTGTAVTPHTAHAPESSKLREIWAAAYRSRYWVAGIFAACVLLALTIALLSTRYYRATASVEVRQEAEKVLGTEQDRESGSKSDSDRFLQTQIDIITSRSMAESVAESEGLYRGDAFLNAMGADVDDATPANTAVGRDARREAVIAQLQTHLKVKYSGSTRIILIAFTSPDPRLSSRIANAYAEAFIRSNLARKAGSSVYALEFLRGQLREAQERLARSEQEVVNYARRTRIVDAGNAAGSGSSGDSVRPQSLVTAQLVQLNQAYSTAIADRIQAQQKWQEMSSGPLTRIPDVLENPAIQTLQGQRAQQQAQYEQQLAIRRKDHPAVIEQAVRLRELDRSIATLGSNIRAGIRKTYEIANAREQQLAREIDALKSSTLSEQNQGIELSILRREADTNRQQYEALLRRYNALNAESGVQTNNLSIVDQAIVPNRPSWPLLPLNIALGLILGMLLSALFVFLREQLFYRLRTPDEVTRALGLPILGVVPVSATPMQDLNDAKSSQSDAFSSVRTSLSLLSRNGAPRSMVVTSTQQGEGKSTATYAIALSFARLGKRVLIIDVDLRRPNVHRLFNLPNRDGLSNLLVGQVADDAAIRGTAQANLDVILAGDVPPNPTELLNSSQMSQLLGRLSERYDVILLDSAPVLGLADAVILANEAEATVFVIEAGRNAPRTVETALTRLRQAEARIAGTVLIKFDPGRLGYGGTDYGYSYEYGSKHGG